MKLKRHWIWSGVVCLLGLAAYGTHRPFGSFTLPSMTWCFAIQRAFIFGAIHRRRTTFTANGPQVKVGRPLYDSRDLIFTFGEADNRVSYPIATFQHLRDDQTQPTLIRLERSPSRTCSPSCVRVPRGAHVFAEVR